jgi:hypothetical protein
MDRVLVSSISLLFTPYHLMSSSCPHLILHFLGPRMIRLGSDGLRGFLSKYVMPHLNGVGATSVAL